MNWGKGFEFEAKGAGKGKKPKPGDWYCPNCGDHNFAKNTDCRKCGYPKPAGMATAGTKPGDWYCPNCADLNFAKNTECRRCGTPNPDPETSQAALEAGIAAAAARYNEKPGDWSCPSCGFMNFARNLQCRKCGTPTPDPEAARTAAATSSSKHEMKPGDWHCTQCGFLNFAKNESCRQCGAPNYQAMYMQMVGAAQGGGKGMQGKAGKMLAEQQQQEMQMNAMNAMMGGDVGWNTFISDWNAMAEGSNPGGITGKGGQYRSAPY